jgi:hypothetical protein
MEESGLKDQIFSHCESFIQYIVQESEIEDLTQKKSILEQMERNQKQKQEEIKRIKKRETHEKLENIQKQHKNETQFRPPLTFWQNNFDQVTKIELHENLQLISFPHDDEEAGCAKKIKGISFLKLNSCTFHKVDKKIKKSSPTSHCFEETPGGNCTNGVLFCCSECHRHMTYKDALSHPKLSVLKEQTILVQNNGSFDLKLLFRRVPTSPKNDTGFWLLKVNGQQVKEIRLKSTKKAKDNEGADLQEIIFTVEGLSSILNERGLYRCEIEFTRKDSMEDNHPNVFNLKY